MDTLYDVGSPSSLRAVSFVIRRRNWKKRSILFKPAVADHDLGVEGAAAAAPSSSRKWIVNRRWLNLQPIVYFEMLFLQLSNLYANEYTITELSQSSLLKRKRLERKKVAMCCTPTLFTLKKVGFLRFANCLGNFGSILFWEKFNDSFNFKCCWRRCFLCCFVKKMEIH